MLQFTSNKPTILFFVLGNGGPLKHRLDLEIEDVDADDCDRASAMDETERSC